MNWLASNWISASLILGAFAFLMLGRRRHAPVSGCDGGHAHRATPQTDDTAARALAGKGALGPTQQLGSPRHAHGTAPEAGVSAVLAGMVRDDDAAAANPPSRRHRC